MAKFEAGNDPANHTVAEVVEYLTGNDATPDEYDRVMQAEREGKNRVGIISGSGTESVAPLETPTGEPAAGPNEAATGQESPADQAKTSSDPNASGDSGVTADQYPDEAPAALGPDMPQSEAEADAHAQTIVAQATQTPEQARARAAELAQQWKTPRNTDNDA